MSEAKAAFDFYYKVDKDGRYHQDAPLRFFKKGEVLPPGIVSRILLGNPEHIENGLDSTKRKEMLEAVVPDLTKPEEKAKLASKQPLYTKEKLLELNKAEQVDILEKLGISGNEIKKLTNENLRIDKILELTNDK